MSFTLTSYGLIFSEHALLEELENSNKTLLPAACIPDLDLDAGTTYVQIKNKSNKQSIVCAVHEYTESPGIIFIPSRLMNSIGLDAGDEVLVTQKTNIPKGEYIKIKPFETAFIELSNPKVVLEKCISEHYPILSLGEVISLKFNKKEYHIEIIATKPGTVIQTTNCDINVDFDKPVDYTEDESDQAETKMENEVIGKMPNRKESSEQKVSPTFTRTKPYEYKNTRTKEDLRRFPGKGYVLGSK